MSTSLAALIPGQTGTVDGFAVENEMTHRLMQMGIIEGVEIEVIRHAPAGDPVEIRVMGYGLSLRSSEAQTVLVTIRG